jgi:UDP-N-acetylglucosamine transferase subunit ALG13
VIFVTVGTNEAAFDRLLDALDALETLPDGESLLVQAGASSVAVRQARCVEFLPYEEVVAAMREARIVITHAGVGSVLTALAAGKRPVVVPRLRRFGEAVDDHQVEFARQLAPTGLIRVVEDLDTLAAALTPSEAFDAVELGPSPALVAELRERLEEILGAGSYSR